MVANYNALIEGLHAFLYNLNTPLGCELIKYSIKSAFHARLLKAFSAKLCKISASPWHLDNAISRYTTLLLIPLQTDFDPVKGLSINLLIFNIPDVIYTLH